MTLSEYLAVERGRGIELARKTGLSQASISRLADGKQKPSYKAIQRIASATANEVSPADWFPASTEAA